jgi:hypothetical protein
MAKLGKWLTRFSRRNTGLVGSLVIHSHNLGEISRDFWDTCNELDMVCIYEMEGRRFGLWRELASLNRTPFTGLLLTEADCRSNISHTRRKNNDRFWDGSFRSQQVYGFA